MSSTPINRLMVLPCAGEHYKACLMAELSTREERWLGRFRGEMVLQSSWTSGSHQEGGGGWMDGGGRVKKKTKKRRQMEEKEQGKEWDKVIKGEEDKAN